jgi:hypothetical protein
LASHILEALTLILEGKVITTKIPVVWATMVNILFFFGVLLYEQVLVIFIKVGFSIDE